LPITTVERLAQGEKPGRAGGAAGSGRTLARMSTLALRRTVFLDGERRPDDYEVLAG
jgi:hypothetical protein